MLKTQGLFARWAVLTTTLVLLAWGMSARPALADEPRLNVVFILADDLGWADTTLYGQTRYHETPHLQRLAQRGITFTHAYSASPLCSPTRSAIMTGLSPARTGITTPNGHVPQVVLKATVAERATANQKAVMPTPVTRLATSYRTLAETFREAGYATAHMGKWHLGSTPYSPLEHGFSLDLPGHSGPGPAGSYVAPWKFRDFSPREPGEHIEDRMASEAVAWIEKHRDLPFFLNYWMFSVHAPFDAKQAYIERHRGRVDPQDSQRCPTYAAMLQSMDEAIGRLLDALDRLQLADRTVIVFTSDNGGNMYSDVDGEAPTSNRPLRGGKATMYEGGTRVPAVVVWPGVGKPGTRCDEPIQSEDYYPTLVEGLKLPTESEQKFDGMSFLATVRGQALPCRSLFQFFPHSPAVPDWLPPAVSVHRGDWKLIRVFHGGEAGKHRYLLYDLATDLGETKDLSAARPDLVSELDAEMERFLAECHAVVPAPNPAFDPTRYDASREGVASREKSKGAAGKARDQQANDDPALLGWKPRASTAKVVDGTLVVQPAGKEPFLGFAPGKLASDATMKFRLRSSGGSGKVVWLATPNSPPSESPKPIPYAMKAGDWVEIGSKIPVREGEAGIVRIYLPAGDEPIEIDWIEITNSGRTRRWDFGSMR